MAGVKGKSGGPRANSGGKRPGAGRKPKAKGQESANAGQGGVVSGLERQAHGGALKRSKAEPVPQENMDMLTFLRRVALGEVDATNLQVRAAIAAAQYDHTKKADGGKKDEAADRAAAVAGGGKYGTRTGPRLVASK